MLLFKKRGLRKNRGSSFSLIVTSSNLDYYFHFQISKKILAFLVLFPLFCLSSAAISQKIINSIRQVLVHYQPTKEIFISQLKSIQSFKNETILLNENMGEIEKDDFHLRSLLGLIETSSLSDEKTDEFYQLQIKDRADQGYHFSYLSLCGQNILRIRSHGENLRIQQTADQIKKIIAADFSPEKLYYKTLEDQKQAVIYYDNAELIRVLPEDTEYYELDLLTLSEKWEEELQNTLQIYFSTKQNRVSLKKKLKFLFLEKGASLAPIQMKHLPKYQNFLGENQENESIHSLKKEMAYLSRKIKGNQTSFEHLNQTVHQFRARFEVTPSRWPTMYRQTITSGFGWRYHPIIHRLRYHSGIDFAATPGDPVFATAQGTVIFAGWKGGYGFTVEIDHGYGISTLYAHNSKLLVYEGQLVQKGDIISRSGATGFAKGPHIHYEVRKFNKPISPAPYLNLNIFSAAKSW